jgi:broad specificity phosphatase PhoE
MKSLPAIYLARHGETAWSLTGQHTGLTDLPLTPRGERNATRLAQRLRPVTFSAVFTSPLERARRTCALAGYADVAVLDPDLVEWNYGDYEGLTTDQIHHKNPTWNVFLDGGPGGESPAEVSARADRVVKRLRELDGNILLFSSGHFLRGLAARWLNLPIATGQYLALDTASLSVLGYDRTPGRAVIRLWNEAVREIS